MEKEGGELEGLKEQLLLRGYSKETIIAYSRVVGDFLKSGKSARQYILSKADKSRSTLRSTYFALQFYFKEVLKRDPRHEEALQGMTEIAERYADLVEKELDQFDYSEAKKYLRRGLSVQPDNGRLLKLSEQTDILKDGPKRLVGKIKSLFD